MSMIRSSLLLAALVGVSAPAGAQAAEPAATTATTVTVTPAGAHVLGRTGAPHRLVEYVSYTCPHCATFAATGDPALKAGPVAGGRVSVELRHYVRDGFDLVATLLARCGPADGFFARHAAIMGAQGDWLPRTRTLASDPALLARLKVAPRAEALALVAGAVGLDAVATRAGVTPAAQAACFADESQDVVLQAMAKGAAADGVPGTPSFTLDGVLLADVHDWDALSARLDALPAAR